jgi:5,10-methylenetetrahydrofolate reductase
MKRILDIRTPLSFDIDKFVEDLNSLDDFDAVLVEERGGLSAVAVARKLMAKCDKEIFLKISCCDRNRIALHSQLATAAADGLLNLVLVDGKHPTHTPFPNAKAVYDLDALGLLRMIRADASEAGVGAGPPLSSLPWRIGVGIGGATRADMIRARKFLGAGADFFLVSSPNNIPLLRDLTDKPIFLSIVEEENLNLHQLLREAESAGADGVSLMAETLKLKSV